MYLYLFTGLIIVCLYTVFDILDILDIVHMGSDCESGNEKASPLNVWDLSVMI